VRTEATQTAKLREICVPYRKKEEDNGARSWENHGNIPGRGNGKGSTDQTRTSVVSADISNERLPRASPQQAKKATRGGLVSLEEEN